MFKNNAAEFVYTRTYSRWIEEESRRENWNETVYRYLEFLRENLGSSIPNKVYQKIEKYMLSFDVMPSMRAVWAAGDAAKNNNVTIYNCAFDVIDSVESFSECLYILMCGTGYGFSVANEYVQKLPIIQLLSPDSNGTYIIPDNKEGWADSIKLLMNSLYEGKDLEFDYSLLRPKGARLKTMGGRSSGPQPLINLHSFIREIFSKAQGRKLKSIECHDICNKIAEIVVVGGVRRSSQISLSDLNDEDMMLAKVPPFPIHRFMANNSAIYKNKPTSIEFLKEWSNLASSGSGERGIFNLEGAINKSPKRRKANEIKGINPCVTGNTEILTREGYVRIDSLVDQNVEIWNGFEWSIVTPKVTGVDQQILTVTFSDGRTLDCTEHHTFHIAQGYTGESKEIKAKDLESGMKLIKHNFPVIEHGLELKNAYTQGFVSADGMDNYNYVLVYEPKYICLNRLTENTRKIGKEIRGRVSLYFKDSMLPKVFIPHSYNLKSKLDWLSGLFDGDGTELKEGGLQLVSVNKEFLTGLQKLLTTLSIQSKILTAASPGLRSMPDGHGGYKDFYCQQAYRICIGAVQMQQLKLLGLKCERMSFNKQPQRDASQFVTITDVTESGIAEKVYCFNEPKRHLGIFNGVLTGQCSEILLRDKQFCNLSEVVVRLDDDVDTLLDKIETATWIGVIQSTFTKFPYLRNKWKENCEDERLLGVSLTGQMDNPELLTSDVLKALKRKAIKVAERASKHLNINTPTAITCVKPSGTVSQLVDSSSGLHTRYSQYYIRRYRIASTDPLLRLLKEQNIPMVPEVGQEPETASTWVIEFPIKAPDNCITRNDMSAIEQLEHYKKLQINWCEHSASATIYVKPDEWFEVGDWVYKNWEHINGVSFLPNDGGVYKLAPYEEISKLKYEKLAKDFPKIDYSQLSRYELEDQTEGAQNLACTSGICEI